MNWIAKGIILPKHAKLFAETKADGGCCDHVEADPELARRWQEERDSFGGDGKYVMCEACYQEQKEEEGNMEVVCHDCRRAVLKKDTVEWRPYDSIPSDGDEALVICNDCAEAEPHLTRVRNDEDRHRHDEEDIDLGDDYYDED
jgi:hypothetical protein